VALDGLDRGNRTQTSLAMDAARRAVEVGAHSAPGSFYSALEQIREAKLALQQGDEQATREYLQAASKVLKPASDLTPPILDLRRYRGARVLNPKGEIVGEVVAVSPDSLKVALGGWSDTWGFVDLGAQRQIEVPATEVAFGPPNRVGMTLIVIAGERSSATSTRAAVPPPA
jgi:hypothetical protein